MCARLTITSSKEEMNDYLTNYYNIDNSNIDDYIERYNAAPSQDILSIISDGVNYRAGFLKWGFIPEFSKDDKTMIINARSETIDIKPAFKVSFMTKRCIIPVDGYYEWKQEQNKKTPYRILMKDESIFALAGIYSKIQINEKKIFTFSIITTSANNLTKDIHDRMPVILDLENTKLWLDPKVKDPALLKSILLPFDETKMTYYEVSSKVNSPKNDDPSLIKIAV